MTTGAPWPWLVLLVFLLGLPQSTRCSVGDRDYRYTRCVRQCAGSCGEEGARGGVIGIPLLPWTCADACAYRCMHENRLLRESREEPAVQYHGRWPFVMYGGMMEPASVVFSLLNIIPHVVFLARAPGRWSHLGGQPHAVPVLLQAVLGVVAFFSSAVFHTRDTWWTERADYVTAFLYTSSIALTVTHLSLQTAWLRLLFSVSITIVCARHLYVMNFVSFSYGTNMLVQLGVVACSNVLWFYMCFRRRHEPRTPQAVIIMLLLIAASALELLDFPPVFLIFDAHSLWHAATPLLFAAYYDYVVSLRPLPPSITPSETPKQKED